VTACIGPAAEQARAAEPRAELSVHDAWARTADSGATTAVYFTLVNTSATPDTLTAITTAEAEESGMHMSMQQGTMMRMAAVRALPVPGKDSLHFAPLGAHAMLMRMRRAVVPGDTVAVTLSFSSGQALEVRAGVRAR